MGRQNEPGKRQPQPLDVAQGFFGGRSGSPSGCPLRFSFDFKLQFGALNRTQRLSLFAREALGDVNQVDAIPAP